MQTKLNPAFLLTLLTMVFIAACAARSDLASPEGGVDRERQRNDLLDLAAEAGLTLRDAIGRARQARPGEAVEAQLEAETEGGKRSVFYEVMIVTEDEELFEVKLDAKSGEVLAKEKATDPEERPELPAFKRVLQHTELSLEALIGKAEDVIKGTPVQASLELKDGLPQCDVLFVKAHCLIEVCLEGRAGRLVELELDEGVQEHKGKEEEEPEERNEEESESKEDSRRPTGPSLTPLADKIEFSPQITHAYFPLSKVRFAVLENEGETEQVVCKVLNKTRSVAGIECLVLTEEEYEGDELKEISYNFFAQDAEGNVYYFGEDVDDYKDGKVVGHGGAWKVGKNAKEPCLFMPAELRPGLAFKRENSPPAAEEFDEVVELDAQLKVPAGAFTKVLVIKEADQRGQWKARKYYAPGVGLVSENRKLNLVEYGGSSGRKKKKT